MIAAVTDTSVNWTQVLVYGVPAWIAAVFAGFASLRAARNGREIRSNSAQLQTPSGDPIGHVVERTHDLAAVATLAVAGVTATAPMGDAGRRLNASADAPVKVNGEILPEGEPESPGAP